MRSVTLKSAITPSFMGLMATMLPGVRPSISFASLPTASTSPLFLLMATMDGSLTTIPLPLAKTSVLAVPRSIARSEENRLNKERKFIEIKVIRFGRDAPPTLETGPSEWLTKYRRPLGQMIFSTERTVVPHPRPLRRTARQTCDVRDRCPIAVIARAPQRELDAHAVAGKHEFLVHGVPGAHGKHAVQLFGESAPPLQIGAEQHLGVDTPQGIRPQLEPTLRSGCQYHHEDSLRRLQGPAPYTQKSLEVPRW